MKLKHLLKFLGVAIFIVPLVVNNANAQTPTYVYPGGSSNNSWPFNAGSTGSNKVQWVYQASQFTPTLPAGLITHVYFRTNTGAASRTFNDMRISLNHASFTTFPSGTYVTGMNVCYGPTTTTISVPSSGWFGVQLTTPFYYDGTSSLIIEATSNNANGVTVAQETSNGNRRIYGNVNNSSGTANSGLTACGLEIVTCSTAVTKQPIASTICDGNNTAFSINAIDVDNYQWQVNDGQGFSNISNGSVYSGATTNTLSLTNTPYGNDGYEYRCLISKTSCADTSDSVVLTVNGKVNMTDLPGYDTTCINAIKDIAVKATGTINNYKWQYYNTVTSKFEDVPNVAPYNLMGNVLQIAGVNDTMKGIQFRCIINGVCDTVTSGATSLVVLDLPKVAVQPVDVNAKNGDVARFEVQANSADVRYQWQVAAKDTFVNINDGGIYAGARSNRLVVSGVSRVQDNFKFRCEIKTTASCVAPGDTSNFAVLYVEPPLAITNVNADNTIGLYPNPTGSDLFIKGAITAGMKYMVVDKMGKSILVGNLDNPQATKIDVSSLPIGMYIVKIINDSNVPVSILKFSKM